MKEFVPRLVKSCGVFDLHDLAEELFTKNIITNRQRRKAIDENTGRPGDERIRELLHIVTTSVEIVESDFFKFLEILLKLGTNAAKKLHDDMKRKYERLSDN